MDDLMDDLLNFKRETKYFIPKEEYNKFLKLNDSCHEYISKLVLAGKIFDAPNDLVLDSLLTGFFMGLYCNELQESKKEVSKHPEITNMAVVDDLLKKLNIKVKEDKPKNNHNKEK